MADSATQRSNKTPPSANVESIPSFTVNRQSTVRGTYSSEAIGTNALPKTSTQTNSSTSPSDVLNPTSTGVSRPFTDSSYRSRFSNESSPEGYRKPIRRRSIFVEELDLEVDTDRKLCDNSPTLLPPRPQSQPSVSPPRKKSDPNTKYRSKSSAQSALSVNPLQTKESYIMQLPVQPFRFSVLLLFLVLCTTISLGRSAEGDLDSLLKRDPSDDAVVQKREVSIAPTFKIGPAVRNPQKDIPKLRTGILVVGIGFLVAALMT